MNPTRGSEAESAGCGDVGEYLLELIEHPILYATFVQDNRPHWDKEPPQPVWECVDHLIHLIVHTIERNTKGTNDLRVTMNEAMRFHRGERLEREQDLRKDVATLKKALSSASQPSRILEIAPPSTPKFEDLLRQAGISRQVVSLPAASANDEEEPAEGDGPERARGQRKSLWTAFAEAPPVAPLERDAADGREGQRKSSSRTRRSRRGAEGGSSTRDSERPTVDHPQTARPTVTCSDPAGFGALHEGWRNQEPVASGARHLPTLHLDCNARPLTAR